MKFTSKHLAIFITNLFIIQLLPACKKIESEYLIPTDNYTTLKNKVHRWLDRQKIGYITSETVTVMSTNKPKEFIGKNGNANIDLLKDNLLYGETKNEVQNEAYKYVIIPIKDELIKNKYLNLNATLNLFLIVNKSDSIIDGYISYYEPIDNIKRNQLAENTFHNIFNNKTVTDNGVYHFLTVAGSRKFDMTYKKNKLYSLSIPIAKNKSGEKSLNSTICIDWYLVTTYYYPNGTWQQVEEYIGKTCGDCDDTFYLNLCSASGGGTGTGGGEIKDSDTLQAQPEDYLFDEIIGDPGPGDGDPQSLDGGSAYLSPFKCRFMAREIIRRVDGVNVYLEDALPLKPELEQNYTPFVSPVWGGGTRYAWIYSFWGHRYRLTAISFMGHWYYDIGAEYRYTDYPWATRIYNRYTWAVIGMTS